MTAGDTPAAYIRFGHLAAGFLDARVRARGRRADAQGRARLINTFSRASFQAMLLAFIK